jgi:hypothetical protein
MTDPAAMHAGLMANDNMVPYIERFIKFTVEHRVILNGATAPNIYGSNVSTNADEGPDIRVIADRNGTVNDRSRMDIDVSNLVHDILR